MAAWDKEPVPEKAAPGGGNVEEPNIVEVGGSGYDCRPDASGKRPKCQTNHCCGTAQNNGANFLEICHL